MQAEVEKFQEQIAEIVERLAANPFDMGTDHWLSNLEQFKAMSRIHTLQHATAGKIKETQREELLALINGDDFISRFFADYLELQEDVNGISLQVETQRVRSARFHDWRTMGESLSVEFREITV